MNAGGFSIDFDTSDLSLLEEALRRAPEIVDEELTAATWESELLAQREIVELTPRGTGQGGGLAGSIIAQDPRIEGVGVLGIIGTPLNYAPAVELGTKPHMPPIEPIRDWVIHKLGVTEALAGSVAWAIAQKIRKHGTEGAHMFKEGSEAAQEQINMIFKKATSRVAARMAGIGHD